MQQRSPAQRTGKTIKKPYAAPRLSVVGTVRDLTLGKEQSGSAPDSVYRVNPAGKVFPFSF